MNDTFRRAVITDSGRRSDRGRTGFTVMEVVLATLVTVVVIGVATRAILNLQSGLIDGTVRASSLETSARLLDRLVAELRDADRGSLQLVPPTDARSITFSTIEGWDGSEPVISAPRTISFDSGTVSVDGTPVAALDELRFNLDESLLTIVVRIDRTTRVLGDPRTVSRTLSAQIRL